MTRRIAKAEDHRRASFPVRPTRAIAALAVVAALAIPVVAAIRASDAPSDARAGEATGRPATRVMTTGATPIPGRAAVPLCPTSRSIAAIPKDKSVPGMEGVGVNDGPTPVGRP